MQKALVASVLFSLVYGFTIVFQSYMLKTTMDPLYLTFISYLVASALILTYSFIKKINFTKVDKKGFKLALATSLFASILGDSFVMLGLSQSLSFNWGILSRLTVPGTFILAMIIFRDKPQQRQLLSIGIAFIGAILVVLKPGIAYSLSRGDFYFICAIFTYSLANITTQKASSYLSTFELASIRILFASLVFTLIIPFLQLSHAINWPFTIFNGTMIIFGTFIVTYIIKTAGANFFAITSNLIPIFTALIAYLFFHDLLTTWQVVGGSLVIFSIIIFQWDQLFPKHSV